MQKYNLISIGDHCAVPEILRKLELRTCSYPFDWIAKSGLIHNTNIPDNFEYLFELMETHDVKNVVKKFLGNALQSPNRVSGDKWFPHETGTNEEIIAKYERRFERLYTDVKEKQNIFIILTRHVVIPEPYLNYILNKILLLNPHNRILFISGSDHPYLNAYKYMDTVRFKHIFYDLKTLDKDFTQDFKVFRPAICEYMRELFSNMGYKVPPKPDDSPSV